MPRRRASTPDAARLVTCQGPDCDVEFEPVRSTAKYHAATCRQRAARARKAAAAEHDVPADPETGDAEHGLVRAVRKELELAEAIDTVAGQLALQLARRIANPEEPGLSTLSKELRSLLAEAKGTVAGPPAPADPAEPEDDEVTKARRRREEIEAAAAAAGD